jgi:hypothetical protein
MMQTQVERCKKEMDYLQSKLKENLRDDTKAMVKFMKEDNEAKEKELVALRLEHKRLTLTLLVSDHKILKIKFFDTSGNAPNSYEQYQRQIDDLHDKFNARDADAKLLTQQVENLKNVIVTQEQTMPPPEPVNAPAPASTRAPAPAPSNPNGLDEFPTPGPGWQFSGASCAANRPNWGNVPPPEPIHDNGWGISPSPAAHYSSHDSSDSSVEPQYRAKGKHAGRSNNNKSKGRGNKYFTQPSGKRRRDSRDDNARDVRQKSRNQDGKSIAEAWSKSPHVRLYVRTLSLEALKTLLISLRSADSNFQQNSKDIPFEKWHENSDTALAHLHKALGMPVRFTVSPHFYYRAAQLPCKNAINMLVNNERSVST